MTTLPIPDPHCFEMIQTMDLVEMKNEKNYRFILPCLVRMCHSPYYHNFPPNSRKNSSSTNVHYSNSIENRRKLLRKILMQFPEANDMKRLLGFDYNQLELMVKKDLQIRLKSVPMNTSVSGNLGVSTQEASILLTSIFQDHHQTNFTSLVKLFEQFTDDDQHLVVRMKLVLHELNTLMVHSKSNFSNGNGQNNNNAPLPSELFDTDIYIDEYVSLIYFAISEMPNTYQLFEVVETLLVTKNGLPMICSLLANFPDSFYEVCTSLINNSEPQNEETTFTAMNRVNVLRKLCQMNPSERLTIRMEAVESCRMPNLVVMLTLDHLRERPDPKIHKYDTSNSDVISFITGILLSHDEKIRTWFSQYIKRKNLDSSPNNCFLEFREELLKRFRAITEQMTKLTIYCNNSPNSNMDIKSKSSSYEYESIITEACLMLRLYCALRGVAMMKFNDEETQAISKMIVCRPPHIDIGVRFVSVGLCMILAFPQMINSQETEIIEWIKWLVKEENYFGQKANTTASFGEMLLLIAIFFHSNQLAMIGDLVSSTIGIKHPLRTNDLTLIKHIFIQDIFTEQTVTSHAIKVPVTKNLNDTIQGALPIHCIYQLLKSRAFTKNKVPIKNWIFNQLCNCVPPIHHILPSLIEAYVNSILIPNTQSGHMTNEPIGEEDLNSVFNQIVYSFEPHQLGRTTNTVDQYLTGSDENDCDDDDDSTDDENDVGDDDDSSQPSHNERSRNRMDVDDDDTETDNEMNDDEYDKSSSLIINQQTYSSVSCLLTSQMLFLYYVLLYEDVRLNNIRNQDRPSMMYSSEFMSRLPIFYLIKRTQTCPEEYGLLRPVLLRLISFHYPHLCLLNDWLPRPNYSVANHRQLFSQRDRNQIRQIMVHRKQLSSLFQKTLQCLKDKSYNKQREPFCYLNQLNRLPDELLWPMATDFIQLLPWILDVKTPKKILSQIKQIWFRLNQIFPTKLWVMTVNVLRARDPRMPDLFIDQLSWEKIVRDPCAVLRCDQRVFRSPELMEITLHILNGFLQALKINCTHHLLECLAGSGRSPNTDEERKKREELSRTFTLVTDSAAVQMLLECCSAKIDEEIRKKFYPDDESVCEMNLLSNRREVQGLICTHLHQCFIDDCHLAKTVAIQGFDSELIPIAVRGIPSLHICLDYMPDFLQNLDLDKQTFMIELTSHLCIQYPMEKGLWLCKLEIEVCTVYLNVLPNDKCCQFFLSVLPSLGRMCQTFPSIIDGFLGLLVQLAQRSKSILSSRPTCKTITSSDLFVLSVPISMASNTMATLGIKMNRNDDDQKFTRTQLVDMSWTEFYDKVVTNMNNIEEALALSIHKTFAMLCQIAPINRIYRDETL